MIMSNGAFMITNNMKTKITNIIRFEYGLLNSKVNGHVIIALKQSKLTMLMHISIYVFVLLVWLFL